MNKTILTFANGRIKATFYGSLGSNLNMARYRYLDARHNVLAECNKDKGLWGKMNRAAGMRLLNNCRTQLHNAIAMEKCK